MNAELLDLPWATLIALASGYAGYWVVSTGIRDHHRQIDILFNVTVFAVVATAIRAFVLEAVNVEDELELARELLASTGAFLGACVAGAIWRRWVRGWVRHVLRWAGLSFADDTPSAWYALSSQVDCNVTQISVECRDGTRLHCNKTVAFDDAPFPLTLGANGDIIMYVTHKKCAAQAPMEEIGDVRDPDWGDEITYVPAAEIKRVELRLEKR